MESWIEQLLPIINEYKDGDTTPLDGDDVDALCKIIKAKINLHEGNINEDEYNQILDKPTPKPVFKIQVIETGEIQEWSLDAILDEINRDRSGSWTDYDETDWLEGWLEWVDGEFYELLFPYKISIHDRAFTAGSSWDSRRSHSRRSQQIQIV